MICMCICLFVCIYIYRHRHRHRYRERQTDWALEALIFPLGMKHGNWKSHLKGWFNDVFFLGKSSRNGAVSILMFHYERIQICMNLNIDWNILEPIDPVTLLMVRHIAMSAHSPSLSAPAYRSSIHFQGPERSPKTS